MSIQCRGCGAFYLRRRWTLSAPRGFSKPAHVQPIFCPACMKMRERYPGGELQLVGVETRERSEVARILCNEEERARQKNPLERIMQLQAKDGTWRIETTTEKLAQRLGLSIKKARGGNIEYKWGHNNKFVSVIWEKKAD